MSKIHTLDFAELAKFYGLDMADITSIYGLPVCQEQGISEGFEGTGFELPDWSKDTGAGSTVDEDKATSGITGAPDGWEDQCLELTISGFDNGNIYRYFETDTGLAYYRFEFIILPRTNSSGDEFPLLWLEGFEGITWELFGISIIDDGTNYSIEMDMGFDPGGNTYFLNAVEDTRYLVEVYYDWTDDMWEWKVDGVSVASGTFFDSSPVPQITYIGSDIVTHGEFVRGDGWTVYVDNWGFSTCGWIT